MSVKVEVDEGLFVRNGWEVGVFGDVFEGMFIGSNRWGVIGLFVFCVGRGVDGENNVDFMFDENVWVIWDIL